LSIILEQRANTVNLFISDARSLKGEALNEVAPFSGLCPLMSHIEAREP
jgi:hypothetical protein